MDTISIIILTYNGKKYVSPDYMDTIVEHSFCRGYKVEVIFLDNASNDGTFQLLEERYSDSTLLRSNVNTLYCRGNNIAMQFAHRFFKSKYMVMMDQDVKVTPGYLDELVSFMDSDAGSDVGECQSLAMRTDKPDTPYSVGHRYDGDGTCFPVTDLPDRNLSAIIDVPSCSIVATIFRTEILLKTGLLNPVFEMYYESSDISFLIRNLGYRCVVNTNSIVYHYGRSFRGFEYFNYYYVFRNKPLFWKLHDANIYTKVKVSYLNKIAEIEKSLEEREMLTVPDEEADTIRKAMIAGLNLSEAMTFRTVQSLDFYMKSDCIVVNCPSLGIKRKISA